MGEYSEKENLDEENLSCVLLCLVFLGHRLGRT